MRHSPSSPRRPRPRHPRNPRRHLPLRQSPNTSLGQGQMPRHSVVSKGQASWNHSARVVAVAEPSATDWALSATPRRRLMGCVPLITKRPRRTMVSGLAVSTTLRVRPSGVRSRWGAFASLFLATARQGQPFPGRWTMRPTLLPSPTATSWTHRGKLFWTSSGTTLTITFVL